MTSFGEPDGDCQASSQVSLVLLSKSLPFLLTANKMTQNLGRFPLSMLFSRPTPAIESIQQSATA
jgi:hypothetical protein